EDELPLPAIPAQPGAGGQSQLGMRGRVDRVEHVPKDLTFVDERGDASVLELRRSRLAHHECDGFARVAARFGEAGSEILEHLFVDPRIMRLPSGDAAR